MIILRSLIYFLLPLSLVVMKSCVPQEQDFTEKEDEVASVSDKLSKQAQLEDMFLRMDPFTRGN